MPYPPSTPARTMIIALILGVVFLARPAPGYEQQMAAQAQVIATKLEASEMKTIAVVDFTDLRGNVTELGRFLAEELSIGLAGLDRGFEVVDRTHLKALLDEHELSATGLIDSTTARELGRIAGVGALITGTVIPLGDSVRLAVKVLDTETARIVTSTTGNIPKTQAIHELLEREIPTVGHSGTRADSGTTWTASRSHRVAMDGFVFRLLRCALSYGTTLYCGVSVASVQGDCELTLSEVSRAVTDKGIPYEVRSIFLGNVGHRHGATKTLDKGIPTKFTLEFSVAPGIEKLSVLEVVGIAAAGCSPAGDQKRAMRVQFDDIAVHED